MRKMIALRPKVYSTWARKKQMTPTDDGGTPASASSATRRFTAVASAALDALRELSYASLPLQQGGRQHTCRGFCCEAAGVSPV